MVNGVLAALVAATALFDTETRLAGEVRLLLLGAAVCVLAHGVLIGAVAARSVRAAWAMAIGALVAMLALYALAGGFAPATSAGFLHGAAILGGATVAAGWTLFARALISDERGRASIILVED